MGWEKYIMLEDKRYQLAIDVLQKAFQQLERNYVFKKDESGFALYCDNSSWPDILQVSLNTANKTGCNIPDGETYIYCLFHIGGNEACELCEVISNALNGIGMKCIFEDL